MFREGFDQNRKYEKVGNQRTGTPADLTVPW